MPPAALPPEWTLSVVSHGHLSSIRLLLKDLARVLDPVHHELILTLNLPENPDLIDGIWPGPLTIIRNARPKGFAANHNAALRNASGRYVATIDPDLRLEGDPFRDLTLALDDPNCGIASTVVLNESGAGSDHARRIPTLLALLQRRARSEPGVYSHPLTQPTDVDWLAGLFMTMRAQTFRQLGGFDERYFMYCEDVDLCLRVWNAGLAVRVLPAAPATHAARRQTLKKPRHFIWHCRSLLRLWTSTSYRSFRHDRRVQSTTRTRV